MHVTFSMLFDEFNTIHISDNLCDFENEYCSNSIYFLGVQHSHVPGSAVLEIPVQRSKSEENEQGHDC